MNEPRSVLTRDTVRPRVPARHLAGSLSSVQPWFSLSAVGASIARLRARRYTSAAAIHRSRSRSDSQFRLAPGPTDFPGR